MTGTYHERFSTPEADIVCVSKDGISFRIPSITLRMTSGFFRATLSLPQPQPADNGSSLTPKDEPIFLSEHKSILERLFGVICGLGILPSELATFDDVASLLDAADKYEMPGVMAFVQGMITHPRFLSEPLRVYALSCRYGWTEEAKMTSTLTLALDLRDTALHPILEMLPAKGLMSLLKLHWLRQERFMALVDALAGSRDPYFCTCGREVNPYGWREWKLIILDEFRRDTSGKSILSEKFLSSSKANLALQQICPHPDCVRVLFNRGVTIQHLRDSIESLPTTIS